MNARRQDFDRDVAPSCRVARAIDLAHPAGADLLLNLVDAESASRQHARPTSAARGGQGPGLEERRDAACASSDSTSCRSAWSPAQACARNAARSGTGRSCAA